MPRSSSSSGAPVDDPARGRILVVDDEPAVVRSLRRILSREHEVVLHEERPVVTTETVPVERVRMETDQVTETETVSGEVRKEQIDADGVHETRSGGR